MIIGIQMGITSGIALYNRGGVFYAASEERFTRIKNDSSYPQNAIEYAIKRYHIMPENIEKVVLASKNMTPVHFLCNIGQFSISDYVNEQKNYYKKCLLEGEKRNYLEVFQYRCEKTIYQDLYKRLMDSPQEEWSNIWNDWRINMICQSFGIKAEKVCIVNHEYAHAAYSFYGSDYEDYKDVIGVVYDGYGDDSNASIYLHEDGKLKQIKKYRNYNIGRIYRYMTLLLGMKPNEHEYKVMGLAPYANSFIYKKPLEIFKESYQFKNGEVIVNPELKDNYYYFKERFEGMRFDGIAAAVQIFTEDMNKQLIQYWMEKTGKTKCVISGGVSMNIKANMEIGKLDCLNDIYVVGSAGDESLCIGAIYYYLDMQGRGSEIKGLDTLYLGDEIQGSEVENVVKKIDTAKYDLIEKPNVKIMAQKLADGLILGRVSGKMEFGARALGNRSIIADPRYQSTIDKINKKIKNRDFWMPFTPSILKEDENIYLDNPKKFRYPFMSVGCESTEIARRDLKAAIHPADYTVRPQLVTKEMNSEYYELICAFKEVTGVGALLNTSLNIHGYPIVRTAGDAFKVLENSGLDGLILDNYLILKK